MIERGQECRRKERQHSMKVHADMSIPERAPGVNGLLASFLDHLMGC